MVPYTSSSASSSASASAMQTPAPTSGKRSAFRSAWSTAWERRQHNAGDPSYAASKAYVKRVVQEHRSEMLLAAVKNGEVGMDDVLAFPVDWTSRAVAMASTRPSPASAQQGSAAQASTAASTAASTSASEPASQGNARAQPQASSSSTAARPAQAKAPPPSSRRLTDDDLDMQTPRSSPTTTTVTTPASSPLAPGKRPTCNKLDFASLDAALLLMPFRQSFTRTAQDSDNLPRGILPSTIAPPYDVTFGSNVRPPPPSSDDAEEPATPALSSASSSWASNSAPSSVETDDGRSTPLKQTVHPIELPEDRPAKRQRLSVDNRIDANALSCKAHQMHADPFEAVGLPVELVLASESSLTKNVPRTIADPSIPQTTAEDIAFIEQWINLHAFAPATPMC